MAYFGTSGPKSNFAHSIAAGYARRANLNSQRGSPGIGAFSIKNSVNDIYMSKIARPYPGFEKLQPKYEAANVHYTQYLKRAADELKDARAATALARERIATYQALKAESANYDRLIEYNRAEEVDTVKAAEVKSKLAKMGSPELLKADLKMAQDYERREQRHFDEMKRKMDSIYMKGMEDYFVEGPLMRESKATLIGYPAAMVVGAGIAAYYAYRMWPDSRRATSNKGAAFAVFS